MARDISNDNDLIDSRDVIKKIEELEDQREDDKCEKRNPDEHKKCKSCVNQPDCRELKILTALAEEGKNASSDWPHGETLIRESYFKEYARELAEDIGAINKDSRWPNDCIDWDRAADELKQDYTTVDYDGVTYYIRS